jgi:hypothetical protein
VCRPLGVGGSQEWISGWRDCCCDALMSAASISEGAGSPTWHAEIFLALSQECELVRIDAKLGAARKPMPCHYATGSRSRSGLGRTVLPSFPA